MSWSLLHREYHARRDRRNRIWVVTLKIFQKKSELKDVGDNVASIQPYNFEPEYAEEELPAQEEEQAIQVLQGGSADWSVLVCNCILYFFILWITIMMHASSISFNQFFDNQDDFTSVKLSPFVEYSGYVSNKSSGRVKSSKGQTCQLFRIFRGLPGYRAFSRPQWDHQNLPDFSLKSWHSSLPQGQNPFPGTPLGWPVMFCGPNLVVSTMSLWHDWAQHKTGIEPTNPLGQCWVPPIVSFYN